jgi:3-oxoacyl-[acyl-carrier protein] reductase
MSLTGKVALVTGASRGIGRAIASALSSEGAELVVTATTQQGADGTASALNAAFGRRVVGIATDLALAGAADALADAALAAFGRVDLLVNNAGSLTLAPFVETSEADFRRVLEVNLNAPAALIRRFLPGMVSRRDGRIVNISSISGSLGTARLASYCASKWALNGLTKALAEELRGTGVFVAAVMPGSTDTDMLRSVGFQPHMTPEDVARVVHFLCGSAPMAMQGSLVEVFG